MYLPIGKKRLKIRLLERQSRKARGRTAPLHNPKRKKADRPSLCGTRYTDLSPEEIHVTPGELRAMKRNLDYCPYIVRLIGNQQAIRCNIDVCNQGIVL